MASMSFSGGKQMVRPPQRGIFPLDHEAECKPMVQVSHCIFGGESFITRRRLIGVFSRGRTEKRSFFCFGAFSSFSTHSISVLDPPLFILNALKKTVGYESHLIMSSRGINVW